MSILSNVSNELINIPSFLSTNYDYGISLTAAGDDYPCDSCQEGVTCEGAGQGVCGNVCQTNICQTSCESVCNRVCQGCQSGCQVSCQGCQDYCEVYGEAPEVDLWSWASSNGSASDEQTSEAYSAIRFNGKVSNFSYLVCYGKLGKVIEALRIR